MSGRILRFLCLLLGLAGLVFTVRSYNSFVAHRSKQEAGGLYKSRQDVLRMTISLNHNISQIVDTARQVAKDLSTGNLTRADIEQRLRQDARHIPALQAIGVAYDPGALEPGMRLYAPYYVRDTQSTVFQMVRLDQQYDYTRPSNGQAAWYAKFSQLKGTWSEPGKDIYNGDLQVVYALSFTRFDRTQLKDVPAGVVFATLALDDFQQLIQGLDLGDEGYAYIVSGTGTYLVHPDLSLINTNIKPTNGKANANGATGNPLLNKLSAGNNSFDSRKGNYLVLPKNISINTTAVKTIPDYKVEDIRSYVDLAIKGALRFYNGTIGNRPCWYFFEPIPAAGWAVGVVLQKDPHNIMVDEQKNSRVATGLLLIVSLTLIAIFVFKLRLESQRSMWAVSGSATVFMAGVIVLIWVLEINNPSAQNSSTVLSSNAVLKTSLAGVNQAFSREGLPPPVTIPTGIFIESFSVDGRDITFTGYVWQKFPKGLIDETNPPDVIFPDSQSQDETLVYQFEEKNIIVVGHYFQVSQMQTFASNKYPLDLATVSLQLQAASLDKNCLLVPDLDSYNATNPSSKPGIRTGLLLNNWNIVSSTFKYDTEPRDMDFGSRKTIKQYNLPTLHFDISLVRFIIPSLLSYGITALVTAILMFTLVVSKAENLRSVLTESFALFFVLVVAHVGLRSELASQGVVYLETLFIMLYGLILLGVLNGLLQFVEFKMPLLSYEDGLLFKLAYWPILFGGFLIVSLRLFYPHIFR